MPSYPEGLLDWAGNRAGGVKKLFFGGSGRPAGQIIRTELLDRLSVWAGHVASFETGTPSAVLLLGGPGNGKTEAVEHILREIDSALALDGVLVDELGRIFSSESGSSPGRLVEVDLSTLSSGRLTGKLAIVQDASEGNPESSETPANLLCSDLTRLLSDDQGKRMYLACVNRGVLDDALILSTERGDSKTSGLLKRVIQSVALTAHGITCWPLKDYPAIAVWPMDVETLVETVSEGEAPATQVIGVATSAASWKEFGACEAGEFCPFCTSRKLLSGQPYAGSLTKILRWYELASGKRWNFRDLFSLVAYLLAGTPAGADASGYIPCKWAAKQLNPSGSDQRRVEVQRKRGIFRLVSSQYQHALFGSWPVERASSLRKDIAELKLTDFPALVALQQFLALDKRRESTATLRSQLTGISNILDPARASPSFKVRVSANSVIQFEDLDRRFSLSIQAGRKFLQKYQCLTSIEVAALKILEEADIKLSEHSVRRQRPATAERVQALLRMIACRIARRSIGVRDSVTNDADVLEEFHRVTAGDATALQQATRQVEGLLNESRRFVVCLNNTFGEPLPPPERRAMLTTDIQRVKAIPPTEDLGRPRAPVRFLRVGASDAAKPIALTFALFKATKSLRRGMLSASLPRSVVALLDTTRAGLAGSIVRNEDALEGAEIRLGVRDEIVVRTLERFIVRQEEA